MQLLRYKAQLRNFQRKPSLNSYYWFCQTLTQTLIFFYIDHVGKIEDWCFHFLFIVNCIGIGSFQLFYSKIFCPCGKLRVLKKFNNVLQPDFQGSTRSTCFLIGSKMYSYFQTPQWLDLRADCQNWFVKIAKKINYQKLSKMLTKCMQDFVRTFDWSNVDYGLLNLYAPLRGDVRYMNRQFNCIWTQVYIAMPIIFSKKRSF